MSDEAAPSALYLGLDIGGTKMAAVIGSGDGTVLHRAESPTEGVGAQWPLAGDLLVELSQAVCAQADVTPSNVAAVGVSCGGPLDPRRGIVLNPPNLPGWRDVPLAEFLIARLENPNIRLENDANATALAEHTWGAGQGTSHMAYLTFGTGMGAGLILDGKLFRGKRDFAGEIGHATIYPDGPVCLCGRRGCLETLASGGALDRIAREKYGAGASAATVCERARRGDVDALQIVDSVAKALGIGIGNLLQTLDLEMVVLGSLAVKAGDLFLEPIRYYTREYTWPSIFEGVQIVPAGLGKAAQDKAALAVALMS